MMTPAEQLGLDKALADARYWHEQADALREQLVVVQRALALSKR